MRYYILFAISFLLIANQSFAQKGKGKEKQYKAGVIGFYNVENLFDIYDDEEINDEEFLPDGGRNWTKDKYEEKLGNMARVISEVGTDISPDGLAIMGTSEVENLSVLEDLVKEEAIKDRNYEIVHYDSPDKRGIDCAMIYNPKYFKVTESKPLPVILYKEDGSRKYTRDILFVKGEFDGETIYVLVNHWPSRSGGEKRSRPFRNAAAKVCKDTIDNILKVDPNAKFYIMGDLNDDPISPSVKKIMQGVNKPEKVTLKNLYNPMLDFFKKGHGTLAYRDAWSLFDQILMSKACLKGNTDGYFLHKTKVFKKSYMIQKTGQYKGYPFRTFGGGEYQGGYSDHLPVYVVLLKEVE